MSYANLPLPIVDQPDPGGNQQVTQYRHFLRPLTSPPGHCSICPLGSMPGVHTVGVPTHQLMDSLPLTHLNPILIVLAQNPGYHEDRAGVPLIGPAGRLFHEQYLRNPGLPSPFTEIATIFTANTARCLTSSRQGPNATQYNACLRHYLPIDLSEILARIPALPPPCYVLTLGAPAARTLHALGRTNLPSRPDGSPVRLRSMTLQELFEHQLVRISLPSTDPTRSLPARVVHTYHPASILRDPNRSTASTVLDHLIMLHRAITQGPPQPTRPRILSASALARNPRPASAPTPATTPASETRYHSEEALPAPGRAENERFRVSPTRTISLDIETYGKLAGQPEQTCFSPRRSVLIDEPDPQRLVLTAAATSVRGPEPATLADLKPDITWQFKVADSYQDRANLCTLLDRSECIIGSNIAFDMLYLRSIPLFRSVIRPFRYTLVDTVVLAWLQDDRRRSKSLKALGLASGLYRYDEETTASQLKTLEELLDYNAQDAHNTVQLAAWLESLMQDGFQASWIRYFSDLIWCCMLMTEHGVPYSLPGFERLRDHETRTMQRIERVLGSVRDESMGLPLTITGSGSRHSLARFLGLMYERAMDRMDQAALRLLEYTRARRELSLGRFNRRLLAQYQPPEVGRRVRTIVRLLDRHADASKLLGTFIRPALGQASRDGMKRALVPQPGLDADHTLEPDTFLSHPTWFVVPSVRNGQEGGTRHGRITCKDWAHQTDPPRIRNLMRSRWRLGLLYVMDLVQIELVVAAGLSGEPSLIEPLVRNHDLHTLRAVDLFGRDDLERRYPELVGQPLGRWKELCPRFAARERQIGKTINFADLFRASAETLQRTVFEGQGVLLPRRFFDRIVEDRPRHRPVLWAWQQSILEMVEKGGHLRLPFTGHGRTFAPDETREALNFPIQGTAACFTGYLQSLICRSIELDPDLNGQVLLCLNVHDSLTFDLAHEGLVPAFETVACRAFPRVRDHYWRRVARPEGHNLPLRYSARIVVGSASVPKP